MPLQNRVDPAGNLNQSTMRGLFTGNRGVIHDPETKTLRGRRWTTTGWICCTLSYGKRRREVWGRNRPAGRIGWSELFFLDEVSALAAGHRPCFFCRNKDAKAFQAAWAQDGQSPKAQEMDRILHGQRWLSRKTPPVALSGDKMTGLPDAAVVAIASRFYALRGGKLLPWGFSGYQAATKLSQHALNDIRLVTPPAMLDVLHAGYHPVWHESANQTSS